MRRRINVASVIALTLAISLLIGGRIAAMPNLYYWYSDAASISYTRGPATFRVSILDSSFREDALGSYHNAIGQWNNTLPIHIYDVQPSTSSTYVMYYGSYSQLKAIFPGLNEGNTGYASASFLRDGVANYQGTTKNVNRHVSGSACVVKKSGQSSAQYRKTALHESGHLLGWTGHSSNSSDVMYGYSSSITTLTQRDKTHLTQIYNQK